MYDKTCWSVNEVKVGCNDVNPKNFAEFIRSMRSRGREGIELCYCNTDYCNTGPNTVAPITPIVAPHTTTRMSVKSGARREKIAEFFMLVVIVVSVNYL